jgi:hypothetical protein
MEICHLIGETCDSTCLALVAWLGIGIGCCGRLLILLSVLLGVSLLRICLLWIALLWISLLRISLGLPRLCLWGLLLLLLLLLLGIALLLGESLLAVLWRVVHGRGRGGIEVVLLRGILAASFSTGGSLLLLLRRRIGSGSWILCSRILLAGVHFVRPR